MKNPSPLQVSGLKQTDANPKGHNGFGYKICACEGHIHWLKTERVSHLVKKHTTLLVVTLHPEGNKFSNDMRIWLQYGPLKSAKTVSDLAGLIGPSGCRQQCAKNFVKGCWFAKYARKSWTHGSPVHPSRAAGSHWSS